MMKRVIQVALLAIILGPMAGWAAEWEWNETGYERLEATGFLRNATGTYQGPGAGTGLTYGPVARLKLKSGFTIAEIGKWYGGIASRVGGDSGPEGNKLSFLFGIVPVTLMGVSGVAAYNVSDGAITWGAVTHINGLWDKLNK